MNYTKPKSVAAVRLREECYLCRIIDAKGPEDPETIARISTARMERKLPPVFPHNWVKFLRWLEDYWVNQGVQFPYEWSADAISVDKMLTVFAELKPRVVKPVASPSAKPMTEDEKAIAEFEFFARPQVKQTDGRRDRRPIVKPLNTTPFNGFNVKE
jgi:hypothetical protein